MLVKPAGLGSSLTLVLSSITSDQRLWKLGGNRTKGNEIGAEETEKPTYTARTHLYSHKVGKSFSHVFTWKGEKKVRT